MKNVHFKTLCAALGIAALAQPAFSHTTYGSWPSDAIIMEVNGVSFPFGNSYRTAIETVKNRFVLENPSNGYFINNLDGLTAIIGNDINEVWFSSDPVHSPAVTYSWVA